MKTALQISGLVLAFLSFSGIFVPGIRANFWTIRDSGRDSVSNSASGHEPNLARSSNPSTGHVLLSATVNVSSLPSVTLQSTNLGSTSQTSAHAHNHDPSSYSTGSVPAVMASTSSSSLGAVNSFQGLYEAEPGTTTNTFPPDVQVAAGSSYLMEMTNREGEIFSKQGLSVKNFTLYSFFNVSTSVFVGDPRVLFDSSSGVWFASILACSGSGICTPVSDNVTVAVSATNNPLGTWRIYRLQQQGNFFTDQPVIGVSADKFVASANVYTDVSGSIYLGAQYWVLNKGEMVGGSSSIDFFSFGPDPTLESVHPVEAVGPTSTLYMVTTGGADIKANNSAAKVFSILGAPPGPVTVLETSLPVSNISPSPFAPQPSTPYGPLPIDTGRGAAGPGDFRIQSAVWFQSKLWLALNDGCIPVGDNQTRSCFRLTQIDTSKAPMVVNQDFDVGAKGLYYYYPSLAMDGSGNLAVIYGYSNSTINPSLATTGQAITDPANTVVQPRTLISGIAPDVNLCNGCTYVRYGDYFGAGLDPLNSTLIWVAGEYVGQLGGDWSTFIASVRLMSHVSTPDFQIISNVNSLVFAAGSSANSTIVLSSLDAFAGSVSLSASVNPAGPTASLGQTNVTLTAGQSSTSTLTVAASASSTAGIYTVTVTGTSGSASHYAKLGTYLVGFNISANPLAVSFASGSSGKSVVTLMAINGFYGNASLSATVSPLGPTISINPSIVSLRGGVANSTLSFFAAVSVPAGLYTFNLTARSGSQLHNILIPLAVTPVTVSISSTATFTGYTVTTSGNGSVDSPSNSLTLSGSLTVTASNATTGKTIFKQTYAVTRVPIAGPNNGAYSSKIPLDIIVTPYPLSSDISITFSGTSAPTYTAQITRNVDINQNGIVDNSDLNIVQASFGCSQGTTCYNPKGDLDANGIVNVFDLSTMLSYLGTIDFLPNFSMSAASTALTIPVGSGATTNIAMTSVNGFLGNVSLAALSSPLGLILSLSQNQVQLQPNKTTSLSLSLSTTSSAAPGEYNVNVTGTSGQLSHSIIVTVSIVDFHIFANPSSLTIDVGSSKTSYIVLTSLAGFSGNVNLAASVTPLVTNAPTVSFATSNVSLTGPGSSITTTVTISASANTPSQSYNVTVTGTHAPLVHSIIVSVVVPTPDFGIGGPTAPLIVEHGTVTQFAIYINRINGFTGNVTLSSSISPIVTNAPTLSFSSRSVQLYLVVGTINSPQENYTVTITGVSGSLSHELNETLVVTDFYLTISPANESIPAGRSGSLTIQVSPVNGYQSTAAFYLSGISGLPSCVSSSFAGSGFGWTLALSVGANCPASTSIVTLQAQDGYISHSAYFVLTTSEFQLSTGPNTIGINQKVAGSVTLTARSVNNYPSTSIQLSVSGLSSCVTSSFSPPSPLKLPQGVSNSTTLTLNVGSSCTSGSISITVKGIDSTIARSVNFTLVIGNFALTTSASITYGVIGSATFSIINVSPFYGVTDSLTMSVSGMPACVTPSFSPATVFLPAGGPSNLTLTVGSSCSAGNFALKVAAIGKRVSQTMNLTLVLVTARNLALKSLLASKTIAYQGVSLNPLTIMASVQNKGSFTETGIIVSFYANGTFFGSATIQSLGPNSTVTVTIGWGTNTLAIGKYVLSATFPERPGETNLTDNRMTGPTVTVRLPGDLNGDGIVNSYDLSTLLAAYGSTSTNSNWNPNADINNDGAVDQIDLNILMTNFGKTG